MNEVVSEVSSETYPYGKRAFVINLVFMFLMIIFSLLLILMGPIDLAWLVVLLSLELLALLVLGISPFLTDHELASKRLILRQGWYFHTSIDLDEIRNVEVDTKGPSRIGVYFKVFDSSVYVVAEKGAVVILTLKTPKRFRLILGKRAGRVVFDVLDIQRLMRRLKEAGVLTLSNLILES